MLIEASQNDIQYIVDILNESYRGEKGWTTEYHLVSGARATLEGIQAELCNGNRYYVLKSGDDYIGCFNLQVFDQKVEIGGLAVKEKYQGLGFGKFLLRNAEQIAASLSGVKTLRLSVLEPRVELINFYLRRGYQKINKSYPFPISRDVGEPIVNNLNVIVLEKTL